MNKQLLSENKKRVSRSINTIAEKRDRYIEKNRYYHNDLRKFFRFNVPAKSSVLEIGCGTGDLLKSLNPHRGVGIDISEKMIEIAKKKYSELSFHVMDGENIEIAEKFDYIILSDTLGYFEDIQKAFHQLWKVTTPDSRIIVTYHNFLWQPILKLAEFLRLKMPQTRLNWLNELDIENLLHVEGFEIIKQGKRFLVPKSIPLLGGFINKYIAPLPFFNQLCLTGYVVARQARKPENEHEYSVSVIIPARNEKGNIENAVKRIPVMGRHTEIVFIEGNSKDSTLDEIRRVAEKYQGSHDVKYAVQKGKGKGDAVRLGFSLARGDILMILDADLTVRPEDLPKFYAAVASNQGEFINGSRLVYPMEKQAMQTLNMFGNKFFSIMFSWILGQRIKDTLCGTKVISRKNWQRIEANRSYFGEFDPFGDFDMIFGAAKLNLKIVEVPVRYQARTYGSTNISRFRHGLLLFEMMAFAMNKIKFA
ncbi:MAG: glycosyltransferase [Chitinivibrionales bacterium]|nr:glycosyltransferase [Chitinivibrionales bacterium]